MLRLLLAAAVVLAWNPCGPLFAVDYLIHLENRGYRDATGETAPQESVLTSLQFVAESDKPFRSRFASGGKLVTARGKVSPDTEGRLNLSIEYMEQRNAGVVVVGPDGLTVPRADKSLARTSAKVKLGQPATLGGSISDSTSETADGKSIRTRSKSTIFVRITEFHPEEMTPEEAEESDQEKLNGVWNATDLIRNGELASDEVVKQIEFRFEQGRLTALGLDSSKPRRFELQLDGNHVPRRMQVTPLDGRWKGQSIPAIYELKAGVLRIAIPDFDAKEPPTKLESTAGSKVRLMTLKQEIGFQRSDLARELNEKLTP